MNEISKDRCEHLERYDNFVECSGLRAINPDRQQDRRDVERGVGKEGIELSDERNESGFIDAMPTHRPPPQTPGESSHRSVEAANLIAVVEGTASPSRRSDRMNDPTEETTNAKEAKGDHDSVLGESDRSHQRKMPPGEQTNARNRTRNPINQASDLRGYDKENGGEEELLGCDNCEEEWIGCDICAKKFLTRDSLRAHRHIHAGDKPFACDICRKRFKQAHNLRKHQLEHRGEKPLNCDTCKMKFLRASDLKKHQWNHTCEKLITCDVCEKGFTTSGSLTVHRRIHTGEKPFICDVCEKGFTTSGSLTSHRRIHTGEKPFICDVCGKMFTQSGSLTNHRRIHTGEKPFTCDVCETRFTTRSKLAKHRRIHKDVSPIACDVSHPPANF